jgi:hypothetical protein
MAYKKILRFIRFCFISVVWTILYFSIVRILLKSIWKFDIFKKVYWEKISEFWEEGGVINSFQEYTFLAMLIAIIPLWLWGWKKANQLSVAKIIFFPIFWYNSYQERKYSKAPKNITLKNMGGGTAKRSPQQVMDDLIASRMPKGKDKKDLNSNKIRSNFEEKSRDFHQKADEQ